jgi:ABC-type sulfate transport system permease component
VALYAVVHPGIKERLVAARVQAPAIIPEALAGLCYLIARCDDVVGRFSYTYTIINADLR